MLMILLPLSGCGSANDAAGEHAVAAMETGLMRTTAYYASDGGLLVPVERRIPMETADVAAALSLLVPENTDDVRQKTPQLSAALPKGVTFSANVLPDGNAVIDVRSLGELDDAASERRAVEAIQLTALARPGVRAVALIFDGKARDTLPHGTPVSGAVAKVTVNCESVDEKLDASTQYTLTLWYLDKASACMIPVTRRVKKTPTAIMAVEELLKGTSLPVASPFPAEAVILTLTEKKGDVSLNFDKSFAEIAAEPDRKDAALAALYCTLGEFSKIKTLSVYADNTFLGTVSKQAVSAHARKLS